MALHHLASSSADPAECLSIVADRSTDDGALWLLAHTAASPVERLAIVGMRVGGECRPTVPPSLGYGETGRGTTIPPYATPVYDVRLLRVSREPRTRRAA